MINCCIVQYVGDEHQKEHIKCFKKFISELREHGIMSKNTRGYFILTSEGMDGSEAQDQVHAETQEIKFNSSGILFGASAVLPGAGSDIHIKTLK